jgi:hypothetical protein
MEKTTFTVPGVAERIHKMDANIKLILIGILRMRGLEPGIYIQ